MKRTIAAAVLVVAAAAPALAQDEGPALRPRRFTVSAGLVMFGGYDVGSGAATLRRSDTTSTPGTLTLFNAAGSLTSAPGVEARIGYTLSRALAVEFGASFSRPVVAVDITGDSEAGGTVRLADQRLQQYLLDVRALWQIAQLGLGSRARPYVVGGGGYLRQLDIDRVNAETGKIFHLGGGVRYWLRGADARGRAMGLRAEAVLQARSGGVDFEGVTRIAPVVSVFAFFGF